MTVHKIATWVPLTDEAIVDYGIGTREQQDAAAVRIEARQRAARAAWYALPLYVRWARRARWRWAEFRSRVDRTRAAWRGDDD